MDSEPAHRRSMDMRKLFLGELYKEVDEYVPKSKLPNGIFVLCRMIFLTKTGKGHKSTSKEEASQIVADELTTDWMNKNVYPLHETTVANKIIKDYKTFLDYSKTARRDDFVKSDAWYEKVRKFNEKMKNNAYDIRTRDKNYEQKLTILSGVKMTEEDEAFYYDNCLGSYQATCSSKICRKWLKQKKRSLKREDAMKDKISQVEAERKADELRKEEWRNNILREECIVDEITHYQDVEYPGRCAILNDSFSEITLSNQRVVDIRTRTARILRRRRIFLRCAPFIFRLSPMRTHGLSVIRIRQIDVIREFFTLQNGSQLDA